MRKLGIIAVILTVFALVLAFTACNTTVEGTEVFTATFYVDGVEYASVPLDANFSLPAAPTKEGYTFTGWYTDQAFTVTFDAKALGFAF